jgi:hypothetical protein
VKKHKLHFSGVSHHREHRDTLYTGDMTYFNMTAGCHDCGIAKDKVRKKYTAGCRDCGIAKDKVRKKYVVYEGPNIRLVDEDGRLESIHLQALAYYALTGKTKGFPVQEIEW